METTGKALVDHWSWAAQKGLLNEHTAKALRSACSQILSALDDWESVDINTLDLDDAINRFENLKGKNFKPQTLASYERRFRRAIRSFKDYIREPSGWSPKSRTSSKKSEAKPMDNIARNEQNTLVETKGLSTYPFPLRQDTSAVLMLPNNLTSDEVKRLHIFMQALVVDF